MKKSEIKYADTSSPDSSTIQIDVSVSDSNSTYNVQIEKRIVKVESENG